jgi:hypothetical protein
MSFRTFWYGEEEKSVRGSFIQIIITGLYLVLIIIGSFVSWVGENLRNLESLLIGFYLVSFGVWTGKKTVEFVKKTGISNMLGKYGMDMGDLGDAGDFIRTKKQDASSYRVADDAEQRNREREAAK